MKEYCELKFEIINESDIEFLTPIMKRAFDEDTKLHLNEREGGPKGYDNGDFLRKYALNEKSTSYKVISGDRIIGAIILWINKNHENFLGNMFIDSDMQNNGIGFKIWKFVESEFPEAKIWRTETPGFSKRNHNFYVNKCGFKIIRIENPGEKYDESYLMEKELGH